MRLASKSESPGVLPRFGRFLQKPWGEKIASIRHRWHAATASIPVPVRLPFEAWWLLRNDNLGQALRTGEFETAELAFASRFLRSGMTVLDIGAHHGLYTLLASRRVGPSGRVFSFEPSPRERRALRLHLALNFRTNVTVQSMALGSKETQADLFVVKGCETGCNSLRPPIVISETAPVRVEVVRLDDWLEAHKIDRVDFIKLDVEGGELEAFKGAEEMLERRPRPVILVEVQDLRTRPWKYEGKQIIEHLLRRGFKWFRLSAGGALEGLDVSQEQFDGNFVGLPLECEEQVVRMIADGSDVSHKELKTAWQSPFDTLRKKWDTVPTTASGRAKTASLLALPDEALLEEWEKARQDITTGPEFTHRGWYHALYAAGMRGKKVMDVGSGFGVDSITFAQHGARLTFVDLVETNLKVLERLCKIMTLKDVRFVHLKELDSLRPLDTDYDVIMAMGSLHHAPMHILKPEYRELIRHLRVGGRWLQLAYPKSRWIRHRSPSFSKFGELTDGVGTPWAEWYDVPKLLSMFGSAKFDVVLYQEFHNSDFNWFDLLYRGMPNSIRP